MDSLRISSLLGLLHSIVRQERGQIHGISLGTVIGDGNGGDRMSEGRTVQESKKMDRSGGQEQTSRGSLVPTDATSGSWVHLRGPVIQANGRLTFEDDLRSRDLLCFTT
jgi:hypothetical protein